MPGSGVAGLCVGVVTRPHDVTVRPAWAARGEHRRLHLEGLLEGSLGQVGHAGGTGETGSSDVEPSARRHDDRHQKPVHRHPGRERMAELPNTLVAAHDETDRQGTGALELLGDTGLHVEVALAGLPRRDGIFERLRCVAAEVGEAFALCAVEAKSQRSQIGVRVDAELGVAV